MDTQLKGRLALVTGASQGIDEAIARALHREGGATRPQRDGGSVATL